jgi:hypothetical protein
MQPRVWPAVRALSLAVRRDLGTFAALRANNFFLFVALLIYGALVSGTAPVSSYPFLALLGFLMLFPLSSDPLARIPIPRLAGWPLNRAQRVVLRCAALALSPMLWLAAGMMIAMSPAALALIVLPVLTHSLAPPRWHPLRRMPSFPGRLAEAVRANLRQMFTILDTWLAVVLAILGCLPRVPPDSRPMMAMLVALSLSTYAQCLFALDGSLTRYRLLPLSGWQIVLAKDLAYLSVLIVLTAALAPAPALAFGFTSLAIGRYPSLFSRLAVQRWRFTGGRVFFGVLQVILGAAAANGETGFGPAILLGAATLYAVSLWWAGRSLLRDSVVRQ